MKTLLITMASGPLATSIIGAIRALNEPWHIVGVDANPLHILAADVDKMHLVPRIGDPNFLPVMRQIIDETRPDFFWPLHDDEMPLFVEMEDLDVPMFMPELPVFELTQDKMKSIEHYRKHGVPVPDTIMINDQSDLDMAFERLNGEIWLRAIRGAGGKGAFRTDSREHAVSWLNMHDGWGTFTAAEVIKGADCVVETIWNNGELIFSQGRTRPEGNQGEISRGSRNRKIGMTGAPAEVTEVGIKAVRSVSDNPHGIMFVDHKIDSEGVPRVTEINAGRFPATGSPTWHARGFNPVDAVLKLGLGEDLDFATPVMDPIPPDIYKLSGNEFPTLFVPACETMSLEDELKQRVAVLV